MWKFKNDGQMLRYLNVNYSNKGGKGCKPLPQEVAEKLIKKNPGYVGNTFVWVEQKESKQSIKNENKQSAKESISEAKMEEKPSEKRNAKSNSAKDSK